MAKPKKNNKKFDSLHFCKMLLAIGAVVIVALAAALLCQICAKNYGQEKIIEGRNQVRMLGKFSGDLVDFVKNAHTGCEDSHTNSKGFYRIVREVPGRFALVEYGCLNDPQGVAGNYQMILKKENGNWSEISPTNQWLNSMPSCEMIDAHKVSKQLFESCWIEDGFMEEHPEIPRLIYRNVNYE